MLRPVEHEQIDVYWRRPRIASVVATPVPLQRWQLISISRSSGIVRSLHGLVPTLDRFFHPEVNPTLGARRGRMQPKAAPQPEPLTTLDADHRRRFVREVAVDPVN